jgi:glucose 1-dehydrogenase
MEFEKRGPLPIEQEHVGVQSPRPAFLPNRILNDQRFDTLLAGKRVLITGSCRASYDVDDKGVAREGIGDRIALASVRCGAQHLGLHSFEPTIDSSRFEFLQTQSRGSVDYFPADLGSGTRETAHALIDSAWKRMGGIDLLVLAAGTYREPHLLDVSSSDFDRIMNLNVKSPFFAAQRYAQRVAEHRGSGQDSLTQPTIIVITSINAIMAESQHALYDGSKAFLEGTLRSWAIDFKPLGISVFGVAPGLHDTPLTHGAIHHDPAVHAIQNAAISSGIGDGDDVANAVIALASGLFAYCSGTIIRADGGMSSAQVDAQRVARAVRLPTLSSWSLPTE